MFSFIERVLTVANARCSYMGCSRRRHVGPCNVPGHEHTHAATKKKAPVVESNAMILAPVALEEQARETVAPSRARATRTSVRPSFAPPAC